MPEVPVCPDRPMPAALRKATDLLTANPNLSTADLAKLLGVSTSYARKLVRRARELAPQPECAVPNRAVPDRVVPERTLPERTAAPAPVIIERHAPPASDHLPAVLNRLESLEQELQHLRASRPENRSRWDLSRRAEVIRRGVAGEDPSHIAAAMQVPQGEVRFILKVQRLLMNAG